MTKVAVPQRAKIVQWPPTVLTNTALGHIRDVSCNSYLRDIGRSSILDGHILFQFGDTFCRNGKGEIIGLSNNTCAILERNDEISTNNTATEYLTQYGPCDRIVPFNGEGIVPEFIERTKPEMKAGFEESKIQSFSGIVETTKGSKYGSSGWAFFEFREDQLDGRADVYQYTGIIKVNYTRSDIHPRPRVTTAACSPKRALFQQAEPRFGSFCIIADDKYLFAYGHRGNSDRANSKDIVLARVPLLEAHNRNKYAYWNGQDFVPELEKLGTVMKEMQHGQIFKSDMFGPPYEYAFIGNSSRGDSKVLIGRAATIEGPFEVLPLNNVDLYALNTGEDKGAFDFRYCVYPHPWAGDLKGKGDLMITWSEGGITGGVLAAMLRLARWA